MALGYMARAAQRVLAVKGEDAFLRGEPAGKVHLGRNVALYPGIGDTADDNHMVRYTVATISNSYSPKVGDALDFVDTDGVPLTGESYVLDRLVGNNGFNSRYIVAAA